MALIVAFRNVSNLADVSDYETTVYVNETMLYRGQVKNHRRDDGWIALVKKFAKELDE